MGAVPQLAFTYASLFGVVPFPSFLFAHFLYVTHLCRSPRMSTPTQVVILGERETTKSANLTPERQR